MTNYVGIRNYFASCSIVTTVIREFDKYLLGSISATLIIAVASDIIPDLQTDWLAISVISAFSEIILSSALIIVYISMRNIQKKQSESISDQVDLQKQFSENQNDQLKLMERQQNLTRLIEQAVLQTTITDVVSHPDQDTDMLSLNIKNGGRGTAHEARLFCQIDEGESGKKGIVDINGEINGIKEIRSLAVSI